MRTNVGLSGRKSWRRGPEGPSGSLESARLPAGDLGFLRRAPPEPGFWRPGAGRVLCHAPIEPWKNPGARGRGGLPPGTTGTKAARGRMQSWKNPSGRRGAGAGAALPPSLACRGGAALGPCPGALFAGGEGGRGRQKMPGGEGWAGLGTGSQGPRALDAVRQPARGAHPVISAAGEGGHTRGTRSAAHGHLAAAAACGGRPLGGAHRPGNGADACAPAHTRSFTRSCSQTRELPAAPWAEGRNGSHRRGAEIDAFYGGPRGQIRPRP